MVKAAQKAIPEIVEQKLPGATSELISLVGMEAAVPILQEFGTLLHEERIVLEGAPPLKRNVTESGLPDTRYGTLVISNKEYRARDALAYDTIDDMLKNGQVIFTLAIKQAAIQSVLRNDRAWRVTGATEEVQKTTKAMMHSLFRTYGKEMMEFMSYGAAFFEKEWEMRSGKEWGIEDSNKDLWGYRDLKAIHPASIKHIDYTRRGHKFNGFTQTKLVGGDAKVKVDKALILTYDKRFRNLFGNPASAPMYPYWFWLEVTWRSFLRYLERTGTPPAIVFAPSTGYVLTADGERVQTMKYALAQAGYISYSNAAAFPSDVRDGNPLWRVQYLETQARGDQFIKAIEQLSTAMSRSIVIGDRAATQSSDSGSYNIAEMHWNVTQLHNQLVLDGLIEQANMFLLDPLVRYNFPKGIGAAHIETQTLDEMQKNRLFGLLNTMGNQQGSAAIETVDWEKVLEINDVPVLSKEDIEKAREEQMKQAVDQQKAFAAVAQDSGQPLRNKDGSPPKQQQSGGQEKVKQSMEWLQYQLLNGATLPVMLTDHQAAEMVDRLIERGKVFDMSVRAEVTDDLDDQVDLIMAMMLSEIDTSKMSPVEVEKLKDYILGLVGFARTDGKRTLEYQEAEAIMLGIGSLLKKAFKAAEKLVNKVVKKITGRDIGEWRKAAFGNKKDSPKYRQKSGVTVVTMPDGSTYVWNPDDHPRDAGGRFATKSVMVEPGEPEPPASTQGAGATSKSSATPPEAGAGKAFDPVKGRSEEEMDKILTDRHIKVGAFGDISEEQRIFAKGIMVDAVESDPYIAAGFEGKKVVFIENYAAFAAQAPLSALEGFGGVFIKAGGLYNPIGDVLYIYGTPDDLRHGYDVENPREIYVGTVVHEMHHSLKVGGRKGMPLLNGQYALEEPTTQILTVDYMKRNYGVNLAGKVSYGDLMNNLTKALYLKNDGDYDAVMKDVKALHGSGSDPKVFMKMISGTAFDAGGMDDLEGSFGGLSSKDRDALGEYFDSHRALLDKMPWSVGYEEMLRELWGIQ